MLFLTRIPVRYNDGSRIPTSELEAVKTRAWQDFGGFTLSGPTEGAWVDDRTGTVHREMGYGLEVVIEPTQKDEAREFVQWAGKRLKQKEMLLIFRDDHVEFIDTRQ